jgi:SAM-dependent methyltransferase
MQTIQFDALRIHPLDRVLDLGCGEGRHAITGYMLHDIESVGVDLSHRDLCTTRRRFADFEIADNPFKHLLLAVANGATLPFGDNSFDKVICSEVLEHIPDFRAVIKEIARVLKPGGTFAASVPRFFPEWICWRLSDAYHAAEGGHIRIFHAGHLREDIEQEGFVCFKKHHAHALHVPYWWLKCLFWREADQPEAPIVGAYHRFLVWDLMSKPRSTRLLERLLNPIMGKSVALYFVKDAGS